MMRKGRRGIVVHKDVSDFESFYKVYLKFYAKFECAIHFRWATCGVVCQDQAHPYEIAPGVWMMHNGQVDTPEWDTTKSDSWHFAQIISEMVEKGWLHDVYFQELIQMAIGESNRLLILDKKGYTFFGKDTGVMWNGVWFSNTYAWDAPKSLSGKKSDSKITAQESSNKDDKEKTKPETGSLETLAQMASEQKVEELRAFWQTQLQNNKFEWRDLTPSAQAFLLGESSEIPEQVPDIQDADYCDMVPATPENLEEWRALNQTEMKLVCYDNPDAVAEAFYHMVQGALV